MLNLAVARVGFGKTHSLKNIILEKIKNNEENLVLVVPDGQIAYTEHAVLDLLGNNNTFKVKVRSFYSLAEDICEKTKKPGKKVLDTCERLILMNMAASSIQNDLILYNNAIKNPEFIKVLLNALDEFKSTGITIDRLISIKESLLVGTLKNKLNDITLIFNSYKSLLENSFMDPLDIFLNIDEILQNHDLFSGYTFLFDGFFEFNVQQLSIIEYIIKQSKDVYIAFCADSIGKEDSGLFNNVTNNISNVINLARKNNVKINILPGLIQQNKFTGDGLKKLEKNFLRYKKETFNYVPNDIVIYDAKNAYDEIDFVAKTIYKLVYTGKFNFCDFTVLSNNKYIYNDIINTTFKRYGIPVCKTDENSMVSPIANTALAALCVICSNFSSNDIFKYLKSGISGFSAEEISNIENYAFVWGISNEQWKSEFCNNPRGFCNEFSCTDKENLEKLNVTRRKLIEPFFKLMDNIKNCDGYQITTALYSFLVDISARENSIDLYLQLIKTDDNHLARFVEKSWDSFIDLMDKMALFLKGKCISVNQYAKILESLVSFETGLNSGEDINSVVFDSFDKTIRDDIKISFVIGCTEKDFLQPKKQLNIFTDEEKDKLISVGLNEICDFKKLVIKEQFSTYKSLLVPSDKLFVTWPGLLPVNQYQRPSEIINEIKYIFPNVTVINQNSLNIVENIVNDETLVNTCAKYWNDNSPIAKTLKHYTYTKKELNAKIKILESASKKSHVCFENPGTATDLFCGNITLSASQIEKYFLCPFQFFCRYILGVYKKKQATLDSLEYGSLMHFVLEKVISKYSAKEILSFTKDNLENIVNGFLTEYTTRKFGIGNNTFRFKYLISRFIKTVCPLILHIATELLQSEFTATGFEMLIDRASTIKPLSLPICDGTFVEVIGKIDRIDVMNKGLKNYVRVIDYKTGTKELVLSDIAYGLNIQMLVYLLAILKSSPNFLNNPIPAGALYMPAQKPMVTADKDVPYTKVDDQKQKKLRMSGLIFSSPEVIYGMEKNANGIFIPVVMKEGTPKGTDCLVNSFEMEKILDYVENRVIYVATSIKKGNIAPYPATGECSACEYCEYSSVCGFFKGNNNARKIEKLNRESAFEIILGNLK